MQFPGPPGSIPHCLTLATRGRGFVNPAGLAVPSLGLLPQAPARPRDGQAQGC